MDNSPHITNIVGTKEFDDAYKVLYSALADAQGSDSPPDLVVLMAMVDRALEIAYMEGFNEGLCK